MTTNFPCSACGEPIKYSASRCPHCGIGVTSGDIAARRGGSDFDRQALLGCIGVSAILGFAAYMIASAGPSETERGASDLKFAEEYELKERNARLACYDWNVAEACDEIDRNAELARYYRQRVEENDRP